MKPTPDCGATSPMPLCGPSPKKMPSTSINKPPLAAITSQSALARRIFRLIDFVIRPPSVDSTMLRCHSASELATPESRAIYSPERRVVRPGDQINEVKQVRGIGMKRPKTDAEAFGADISAATEISAQELAGGGWDRVR